MQSLPTVMFVTRRQSPLVDFLRRLFAAGAATLVLALVILAASPQLHAWLHGDEAGLPKDDDCAVVLFANGVSSPVAVIAVPLPPVDWQPYAHPAANEIFLATARYLHQPERGPPLV